MRQRVLIAMALACEPSLIIADEPTTAPDVTVEGQIIDLVDELQAKYGTSFLWVTHDLGVVAEICDRVNVMYLGEIVEQAPVDELFYDTKHPYTDALLNSIPRPDRTVDELEAIEGVMPEAIDPPSGCRFHPRCPDARAVCKRVHPDAKRVADADGEPHRAACVKHDVFDVGYDESPPLEGRRGPIGRRPETSTSRNRSHRIRPATRAEVRAMSSGIRMDEENGYEGEETLLELEGVSKYFAQESGLLAGVQFDPSQFPPISVDRETVEAVDDVSLEIQPGETLGLVGESGCGKSTLGRTVLRLLEPTEGDIYFKGRIWPTSAARTSGGRVRICR